MSATNLNEWERRAGGYERSGCRVAWDRDGDLFVDPNLGEDECAAAWLPPKLLATLLREQGWTCEPPAPVVATGLSTPIPLVRLREDDPSMHEVTSGLRGTR